MKLKHLFIALLVLIFLPLKSWGAIYILVDQFSPEHKFPIAIGDFINDKSKSPDEEGRKLAGLLRRDMQLAGYFDLLNVPASLNNDPEVTPEAMNFGAWSATGSRVFVKGVYRRRGKSLTLELRLYDPQLKQMLVGKEYKVKKGLPNQAIHRFADEIMLVLTGERGIFGTKVAAACGPRGKEQIVVMNVDGSERTPVTNNTTLNLSPAWSPSGKDLVFTSYQKYFPELYLAEAKGSESWSRPKRLTFNNTLNITPTFSPDGQTIALSSSMGGEPDLHLIDLKGQNVAQLTKTLGIDISPTFSPNGELIAFSSERAGNLHIFVTDRTGQNTKRLTFSGYQNDTPAWSPRGDKIAFVKRADGGFNIFTMNADGTQVEQLTSAGNNENPTWSPDGRYLIFKTSRIGDSNLFIMMWDGSNQMAITQDGMCKTPEWSPWLDADKEKSK